MLKSYTKVLLTCLATFAVACGGADFTFPVDGVKPGNDHDTVVQKPASKDAGTDVVLDADAGNHVCECDPAVGLYCDDGTQKVLQDDALSCLYCNVRCNSTPTCHTTDDAGYTHDAACE